MLKGKVTLNEFVNFTVREGDTEPQVGAQHATAALPSADSADPTARLPTSFDALQQHGAWSCLASLPRGWVVRARTDVAECRFRSAGIKVCGAAGSR